jgi:hypothetical protein
MVAERSCLEEDVTMRSFSLARVISILAVMFAMFFGLSSATMAKPADNGGPGNSGAAKLCQDGNWMYLARFEQPMVAFANQDECVSYGAQGGTLVDLEVVPEGIYLPAGSTAIISGALNGCNALAGSWSADNGSSGSFGSFDETYNSDCGTTLPISTTIGPFAEDTLLTFTLTDNSCGVSYTQDSNHGSWSATSTGYQVDIADAGTYCEGLGERIPAPGTGHLSLTVDVVP